MTYIALADLRRTEIFLELEQIIFQIRTRTRTKTSNFSNSNVELEHLHKYIENVGYKYYTCLPTYI